MGMRRVPTGAPDCRAVEAWRDRTFRRLPPLAVRGERSALRFLADVGFCFTLSDFGLPVASLHGAICGRRHPRWPRHTHHDPAIGLAWNLKDRLPAKRLTYYGKLVKGKPTLVALDLIPAFCALTREGKGSGDYVLDFRQGRMSRAAVAILDALHDAAPRETPALRRAAGISGPARTAEFDRAMAELQRGLWIAKVEEVYEPDFYYRWDLLDNWLPEAVEAGRLLSRAAAAQRLLTAYLRAAGAAAPRFLAGLFAVSPGEVAAGLRAMEADGRIRAGQRIGGWPGEWAVWTELAAGGLRAAGGRSPGARCEPGPDGRG
jgi:hypothetical protein